MLSKITRWIYALISLPYLALFLVSLLAYIVPPQIFNFFAPFSLLFFPLYIGLFFVLILWILKRSKRFVIFTGIMIFLGGFIFSNYFSYNPQWEDKGLKIMSWNVKNFDLYNWNPGKDTRNKMLNLIDSLSPDVICMQEFYNDSKNFKNIEALQKMGYPYIAFFQTYKQGHQRWGVATASKFPIAASQKLKNIDSNKNNIAIVSEIRAQDKKYFIVNAHLQSIHFGYDDYAYLEQLKKTQNLDKAKTENIFKKLLVAYPKRQEQLKLILGGLENYSNENVVFCCDLNDVPSSYSYFMIQRIFSDAFSQKGTGLMSTFDLPIPFLRIDFIFTSKNLKVNSFNTLPIVLSDHFPLVSFVE